jgi:hypothetical protein
VDALAAPRELVELVEDGRRGARAVVDARLGHHPLRAPGRVSEQDLEVVGLGDRAQDGGLAAHGAKVAEH